MWMKNTFCCTCGLVWLSANVSCRLSAIATFRLEHKDDYEYEFKVLSTRTSKIFARQTWSACSVRKTRTRSRPRTAIWRSLITPAARSTEVFRVEYPLLVEWVFVHVFRSSLTNMADWLILNSYENIRELCSGMCFLKSRSCHFDRTHFTDLWLFDQV